MGALRGRAGCWAWTQLQRYNIQSFSTPPCLLLRVQQPLYRAREVVLLSKQIDWEAVESEFAEYYCADNGRPSVSIRTMVGMMLLKSIYNLSDEGVVARWLENPYMQYFTGEKVFQKRPPMNPRWSASRKRR